MLGIDVAWTKPAPEAVVAAGYGFVCGYLSTDSGKNLQAADVAGYHAAGLDVFLVWETTSTRATDGAAAGASDAALAVQQADALGAPHGVCLFYAVDEQVGWAQIVAYAQGFARVARAAGFLTGPYGDDTVVEGAHAAGLADCAWQAAAWSSGQISAHATLYQRVSKTRPAIAGVAGDAYDEDVQLTATPVGAWPAHPTPLPVPQPTPAPAPPVKGCTRMTWIIAVTGSAAEYVLDGGRIYLLHDGAEVGSLLAGGASRCTLSQATVNEMLAQMVPGSIK